MTGAPAGEPGAGAPALRLSKVVAAQVPCSRSQAEQLITEGWVRVDGQVQRLPESRVTRAARVDIDPRGLQPAARPVALLLHQPAGMDATGALTLLHAQARWEGDASGLPWSPRGGGAAPVALMPLPAAASGLAVFGLAPGVVRKLTDEAQLVEQELIAQVTGTLPPDGLARLGRALVPGALPPARVSWQSEGRLRIAAKGLALEGVAGACAQTGLALVALRRIRIGRVPMAQLPEGRWRCLHPGERF